MVNFICEIGSNHNNDPMRTLKIIDEAAMLGFWGIKFQLFRADTMFSDSQKKLRDAAKENEVDQKIFLDAANYTKAKGLKFGASIFDIEFLENQSIVEVLDFTKISSFDSHRLALISKCMEAVSGGPIFISMGLVPEPEEDHFFKKISNIATVHGEWDQVHFFHCVSDYPAPISRAATSRCREISYRTENVGYSDHTVKPAAILSAIHHRARTIEVHYDLKDLKGAESSHGHCWTREKIEPLFDLLRDVDVANNSAFTISEYARSNKSNESGRRK